jgi:hypothetical protein
LEATLQIDEVHDKQSKAYEEAIQMASRRNWTKVFNLMMEDGFDEKMDYVQLLELWRTDSAGELCQ